MLEISMQALSVNYKKQYTTASPQLSGAGIVAIEGKQIAHHTLLFNLKRIKRSIKLDRMQTINKIYKTII